MTKPQTRHDRREWWLVLLNDDYIPSVLRGPDSNTAPHPSDATFQKVLVREVLPGEICITREQLWQLISDTYEMNFEEGRSYILNKLWPEGEK